MLGVREEAFVGEMVEGNRENFKKYFPHIVDVIDTDY
jgi:hypothetical protein